MRNIKEKKNKDIWIDEVYPQKVLEKKNGLVKYMGERANDNLAYLS